MPPTVPLEADLLVAGTLHMDLAVLNDVAVDLGVCAVPSGSDAGSGSGSLLGTGVQSLCGTEDADVVYAFPAIVLGTGSDRTWSAMLPIAALLGAVGGEPGDVRISARASGGCSGDNSSARGSDTMAFEVAPPPDGGLDAGSASGSGSGSGSGSD